MVTLRNLEPADIDAVHALISRMDVVRHMLLPLCSREESEKFLRDSLLESPSDPWRSMVRAIATDGPPGNLVGLCGVAILRGAEEGEIWYLVEPESWGKGIASEAAKHPARFWIRPTRASPDLGYLRSGESRIRAGPGESGHAKGRVPRRQPQDPRRVEELLSVRHTRR